MTHTDSPRGLLRRAIGPRTARSRTASRRLAAATALGVAVLGATILGGGAGVWGGLSGVAQASGSPLATDRAATPSAQYQEIRVPSPLSAKARELLSHPDFEALGDDDGAVRILSTAPLTRMLQEAGLEFEVLHSDLESFYAQRLAAEPSRGTPFGIFHTYGEAVIAIEDLYSEFPNLMSEPISIGTSHEGRDLWAFKISDNPEIDEDEPEVLFDGMHHPREIITLETILDFSRFLCESYESDPVVRQLVDSREIWFVPVVNPDGLVYNEATNPGGGGLWRKNRAVNSGSSCRGVDLNRNYDFEWVGSGSSTDPCSETFRGPSPSSEPEIIAHTNFIDSREFVTWQSFHSTVAMVLLPWGYTNTNTPDDAVLRAIATEMSVENGYQVGQPGEILYNVNGGAFDWGYGATANHEKIFGFTTEIGGSGFWPAEAERDPLIAQNLAANLFLCQVAGSWLEVVGSSVDDGAGNGALDPGETASLVVTVRNAGVLSPAPDVSGVLRCDDPYIELEDATAGFGTLAPGAEADNTLDALSVTVDPACPQGREVAFQLELSDASGLELTQTFTMIVGVEPVILAHDFEASSHGWTTDPTHTASSGSFVRIDPNPTSYQPGDDVSDPGSFAWITGQNTSEGVDDVDNGIAATRSAAFDLSGYDAVLLDMWYFFGQRDAGDDPADFFSLDVSGNGGADWANLVSIGDVLSPAIWKNLKIDLADVIPLSNQVVLRVQAADGTTGGSGDLVEAGIDEVRFIDGGTGNDAPGAPGLLAPADGSTVGTNTPVLQVSNAVDPEGDPLTYSFRVYDDATLTQEVAAVDGVAEGGGSTSWTVTSELPVGTYYWRAFAADPETRGLFMSAASFEVETATGVAAGSSDASGPVLRGGPSPSQGPVTLRYYAPETPDAALEIFDTAGRRVRVLPAPRWTQGWQTVEWDGRDEGGARVSSGVYFVKLVLPRETRSLRIVRIE